MRSIMTMWIQGLRHRWQALIVLEQPIVAVPSGKGVLHDPALGQDRKALGVGRESDDKNWYFIY